MTLNTGIFDVSDPQNPDRMYSAALLCRMMAKQIRDGIVHEDGNEMAVTVTDPPAMTVLVGTGTAMVQGRFCENDAALTLAVTTAHATYPRIDRVVVRLNASPGRTIDIVVKPGTAAPEPAAPALTRTAETWEISLAQVRVEAGATSIVAAKITDERGNASLCGVAAPVYVPSSVLEIVEGLAMQGKALTGLPAPSGSTDAARKGYVDAEIAGKIGGFGISQIAIDADKDWGGKSITNVGTLSANSLILLSESPFAIGPDTTKNAKYLMISDDVETSVASTEWTVAKSLPPLPAIVFGTENSVYVSYQHRSSQADTSYTQIVVNGEEVGTIRNPESNSYTTYDEVITGLKAGDIIQIRARERVAGYTCYVRNLRVYGGTLPLIPMVSGIW